MSTRITPLTKGLGVAAVAVMISSLAACSTEGSDGTVEISYLTSTDETMVTTTADLIAAFEEANPDITVSHDVQPPGSEYDNLTKTKLATGEMNDVFWYNTGSLLQPLDPDGTLVDLSDQPWMDLVTDDFKSTASTDAGVYGAPYGTSFAGGMLYNKEVFADLGLEVPTSWGELMSTAETIGAAGIVPILQTYGSDWSAQLILLSDYANVAQVDPEWADKYTANEAKFVDEPALAGFRHQQEAYDAGLFNEDFASLTYEQGLLLLADGDAAMYPALTAAVPGIEQTSPDQVDDIGYFAMPADDPQYTAATIWQPNALYIPATTTGAELDAALKFIEFVTASEQGCDILNEYNSPTGPYVTTACAVPDDALAVIGDLQTYFDSGLTAPALEYLSPVKGPNLPAIAIAVGSGINTAEEGAALYDDDVRKQAQQLGLEGW